MSVPYNLHLSSGFFLFRSIFTCCVCLLLVVSSYCVKTPKDTRIATFLIVESSSGVNFAELLSSATGKKVRCTFEYTTTKNALPSIQGQRVLSKLPEIADQVESTTPLHLITLIKDACVTTTVGYWTYESQLCLNGKLRQSHGADSFDLGSFSSIDAATGTVLMGNGMPCDALPGRPLRRTEVQFGCNPDASAPRLVSIVEPSTCVYTAVVVFKAFCENKIFPVLQMTSAPASASNDNPSIRDGHEDWFMQLSESAAGEITCSIQTLEVRDGAQAKLTFAGFSVTLDGAFIADSRLVLGRKHGREQIPVEQYTVGKTTVKSADTFGGKLAHLRISAHTD